MSLYYQCYNINAVKQIVKIFENGVYLFHCSYYKFLEGFFASRSQLTHSKMCTHLLKVLTNLFLKIPDFVWMCEYFYCYPRDG